MANHKDAMVLAEQALGLRDFARSLAYGRDPDDLVQQTAISALKSPIADADRRPWLRRVLRNHARQRHRSEQRRVQRETHWASAEADESSPEQQIFRAQLLATLGQALAELEEPYRHTMHERFVRGLSAAEIARRTDTPSTTVRSRIQHAIEQLREVLDDRFGGRTQWCPALMIAAGVPRPEHAATTTTATSNSPKTTGGTMIKTGILVAATATTSVGVAITWGGLESDGASDGGASNAVIAPALAPAGPAIAPRRVDVAAPSKEAPVDGELASASAGAAGRDGSPDPVVAALLEAKAGRRQQPLLLALHGGGDDDPDRDQRQGKFAECEDMVLPVDGLKVVAFDWEGEGHDKIRMDLIRDDVGRPEVVECLRAAFDELMEAKRLEYPDYDEHSENIVGAIFGGEPPVKRGGDLPPEDYPLAVPGTPTYGDDDAATELVVCGDYDSALTRNIAGTLDRLQADYGADLRLRWLQAPVTGGRRSLRARAAVAAQEQGGFWAMHPRLMSDAPIEDEAHMKHLAEQAGLDVSRFMTHLSAESTFAQIDGEHDTCTAHGGLVEPQFFVGEASVAGAVPFERLAALIDKAAASPSSAP